MAAAHQTPKDDQGLLIEPWLYSDLIGRSVAERRDAVLARGRRLDPRSTAPLDTLSSVSSCEEYEIAIMFLVWATFCLTPLLPLVWFYLPLPRLVSAVLAGMLVLACTWPHDDWPVPPKNRVQQPLRNVKTGIAFVKYFPMRCILEDEGAVLREARPLLLAGVPHGLFPIGLLCLSMCNALLPLKWTRGAVASIVMRLPLWRQVLRWNGGIEVTRGAITAALEAGDNVAVMSDGIAGMFAAAQGERSGKEVFLLKKRRGLVRIALETGAALVPVVCFGNTRTCLPATDGFGLMEGLSRLIGVSIIWINGRWGLPVPKRAPVTVVIGRPLHAPPEVLAAAVASQLAVSAADSATADRRGSSESSALSQPRVGNTPSTSEALADDSVAAPAASAPCAPPVALAKRVPIPEPPEELVDLMHEQMLHEVSRLYYRWRVAGGYAGVDLEII